MRSFARRRDSMNQAPFLLKISVAALRLYLSIHFSTCSRMWLHAFAAYAAYKFFKLNNFQSREAAEACSHTRKRVVRQVKKI
jgi:hypothetical protein